MSYIARRGLPLLLTIFLWLPINACSKVSSGVNVITQTELVSQLEANQTPLILDVRTQREYDSGHIPGAINIEFRELKKRISEIESHRNKSVIVYCEHGIRANIAEYALMQANFQSIFHLEGDMSAWRKNSLPINSN